MRYSTSLLIWTLASPIALAENNLYFNLNTENFSEPTSIDSFRHNLRGDIRHGDHAYSLSQAELGSKFGAWRLSLVSRLEYFFQFSPDTPWLYHDLEQGRSTKGPDTYQISLKVNHLRANGLKLAYQWAPTPDVSLSTAVTYLDAQQLYHGQLSGQANWQASDSSYNLEADMALVSYRDIALEFPVTSESGRGYSADLALSWQLSTHWSLNLSAKDLLSQIQWQDVLFSDLNVASDVAQIDQQGRFQVRPYLQGRQLLKDHRQTLPKQYRGRLLYQYNAHSSGFLDVMQTSYFHYQRVGMLIRPVPDQIWEINWNLQQQALGIGYQTPRFRCQVISDHWNIDKARALSLSTSVHLEF